MRQGSPPALATYDRSGFVGEQALQRQTALFHHQRQLQSMPVASITMVSPDRLLGDQSGVPTVTRAATRASIVLLSCRTTDLVAFVDLPRSTMPNLSQNIAGTLSIKGVFLVTTILGVTGLWPAILADTGATVLVTMNALRLLRAGAAES